jgi:hypothetical protein
MIQFYFLSVFLNLVGGYALVAGRDERKRGSLDGIRETLRDQTSRLVIGILVAVTGAFKLLTVIRGDIPVVGDFLPAVAGITVGATLLLGVYRSPVGDKLFGELEGEAPGGSRPAPEEPVGGDAKAGKARGGRVERFLLENDAVVGIAGMIAGLVHFLFPAVLFL